MTAEQPEKIIVECTSCGGKLRLAVSSAGKRFKCPKCGEVNTVPMGDHPAESVAQPSPPPYLAEIELSVPLAGDVSEPATADIPPPPPSTASPRLLGEDAKGEPRREGIAKAAGAFALGTCLSGVAALVGGTVWFLVAWHLNAEVGYVAWGVGILCGLAMRIAYRTPGAKGGVGAAIMAAVGILGAKVAIFIMVISAVLFGNTDNIDAQREFVKVRLAYEILDDRGVVDDAERDRQWESAYDEANGRVTLMNDEQVREKWQQYKAILDEEEDAQLASEPSQADETDLADATDATPTEEGEDKDIVAQEDEAWVGALLGAFVSTQFSIFDLLWFFLALSSAYRIGSGKSASAEE